jgi:hypothetical protein
MRTTPFLLKSAAFLAAVTFAPAVMAQSSSQMGSSMGGAPDQPMYQSAPSGQPMTNTGLPRSARNAMMHQNPPPSSAVPGTFGNPTTPNLVGSNLGANDRDRATASSAAVGEPVAAGSAASAQSYHPTSDVIGKGPPGPGVKMPSPMLVPPGGI